MSSGRNTHFKQLSIWIDPETFVQLRWRFFRGLALNSLIEKLDFYCDITCDKILLYLIPFFVSNKAIETLEITYINTDLKKLDLCRLEDVHRQSIIWISTEKTISTKRPNHICNRHIKWLSKRLKHRSTFYNAILGRRKTAKNFPHPAKETFTFN